MTATAPTRARHPTSAPLTVLVTGVGGGGVGHQMVKSLKRDLYRVAGAGLEAHPHRQYHVVGTDMTEMSLGLHDVDEAHIVPRASHEEYTGRLLKICAETKARVIIPGSEPELAVISQHRHVFIKAGILPLVNAENCIRVCMDKWETYEWLRDNGFNMPWSTLDSSEFIPPVRFPVIVKPTVASGGSLNVYIAQDTEEVRFFCRYLKRQGLTPMVQEYAGDANEEYTVGVLTDMDDGSLIGSIALKRFILSGLSARIRTKNRAQTNIKPGLLVVSSGISQGEIGDFPDVRKVCEEIALEMGSRGPMNFQCRKDARGKVWVFEINPRFSGTSYIRAMVGFNEADMLIRRHVLGEKVEAPGYKKGLVLRGLEERFIEKR